jgi:hypothetical protein
MYHKIRPGKIDRASDFQAVRKQAAVIGADKETADGST